MADQKAHVIVNPIHARYDQVVDIHWRLQERKATS